MHSGEDMVPACATYVAWSKECTDAGRTFTVRMLSPWDPRLVMDFTYSCDCPDFRRQPGVCIHILSVKGYHCDWHSRFDAEVQSERGVCPRCGGPTTQVRWVPR